MDKKELRAKAMHLIILFGLVSLFGDIIYEGARSVNGPYLKTLGANAVLVGFIVGIGEFLGYAIRLVSGYFSDKTKAYWIFTFVGYGLLISVPLLSLAGVWQIAALFMVTERIGKALRSPARDTIVSQAAKQVGTGFGFGLSEVMDQIGALTGPLIFSALFFLTGAGQKSVADYQKGYGFFWVPLALLIICVTVAYRKVPHPELLEDILPLTPAPDTLSRTFWLYTLFTFITTAGFVNFALMGYHYKAMHLISDAEIPLLYTIAMAVDGAVALGIGKAYDVLKQKSRGSNGGLAVLIVIPLCSLFIPLLAFSRVHAVIVVSAVIWGVVMGAHETIMKSAIADITPLKKRGTGYGVFNTSYGLACFAGSVGMGFLYEHSLTILSMAAILLQITAVFVFFIMRREAARF